MRAAGGRVQAARARRDARHFVCKYIDWRIDFAGAGFLFSRAHRHGGSRRALPGAARGPDPDACRAGRDDRQHEYIDSLLDYLPQVKECTLADARYDDRYETCERTVAELRIYGDDLDPDEVSGRLGLQPTARQRKGDRPASPSGRPHSPRPVGLWALSSEGSVESLDLRRHLDWLIARLRPLAGALDEISRREGVRMHVTCIWWSRYGDGGPILGVEQMAALAGLGLECQFELGFYGGDDEFQDGA